SSSAARLDRLTASWALSTLDTNGKVTGRNSKPSNCVMRLWPMVSAVTPVWSETKKTVRRLTVRGPYGCPVNSECFTAVPSEQALCALRPVRGGQVIAEECL